ncbi:MAG: methyltransferase domain-containing protein [Candidatus Paceibacterota bacterium]
MIRNTLKKISAGFERASGLRIIPSKKKQGLYGACKTVLGIKDIPPRKPDPKEYSTIVGKGSIVPCQQESYFLALREYVQEKDVVLDVGFGLGYGMNILSIKAGAIHGVDIDKKVYDYCNETLIGRNPKIVKISLYDGYKLDYPDNFFDVVTCGDVIEHVEDYHRLIKELLRVSKRGLFLNTPNRRPEYTNADGTPKNYWHLREWNYEELDKIIKQHGKPDWNFINGPFEGPFTISKVPKENTLALSPFIRKS